MNTIGLYWNLIWWESISRKDLLWGKWGPFEGKSKLWSVLLSSQKFMTMTNAVWYIGFLIVKLVFEIIIKFGFIVQENNWESSKTFWVVKRKHWGSYIEY